MSTQKSQRRCCTESELFTTIVWKLRKLPTYLSKKYFLRSNIPHFFHTNMVKTYFLLFGEFRSYPNQDRRGPYLAGRENLRAEKKNHFREAKSTTSTHKGFPKVEWRISRRGKRWMCALLAKEEAEEGIFPNAKSKEKKGQQQRHRTQDY